MARLASAPRVGLDVGVLGAEKLLDAGDGEVLGLVDDLAAAVVALAGVAFGVLVGEDGAHGFEHGGAGVVLRRDEFEAGDLALFLAPDDIGDGGICVLEDAHGWLLCQWCGPRRCRPGVTHRLYGEGRPVLPGRTLSGSITVRQVSRTWRAKIGETVVLVYLEFIGQAILVRTAVSDHDTVGVRCLRLDCCPLYRSRSLFGTRA